MILEEIVDELYGYGQNCVAVTPVTQLCEDQSAGPNLNGCFSVRILELRFSCEG